MKDRYFFFFWVFSVLFGECGAITARRTPRNGPGEGPPGRFGSGKSGVGKPQVRLHFSELRRADADAPADHHENGTGIAEEGSVLVQGREGDAACRFHEHSVVVEEP